MKYKIIRGVDIKDLADAVQESIDKGWEPLGGPSHNPPTFGEAGGLPHPYWQAMLLRPGMGDTPDEA